MNQSMSDATGWFREEREEREREERSSAGRATVASRCDGSEAGETAGCHGSDGPLIQRATIHRVDRQYGRGVEEADEERDGPLVQRATIRHVGGREDSDAAGRASTRSVTSYEERDARVTAEAREGPQSLNARVFETWLRRRIGGPEGWTAERVADRVKQIREGFRIPLLMDNDSTTEMAAQAMYDPEHVPVAHQRRMVDPEDMAFAAEQLQKLRDQHGIRRATEEDWREGIILNQIHVPADSRRFLDVPINPSTTHKRRMVLDGTDGIARFEDIKDLPSMSIKLSTLADAMRTHGGPDATGWIASDDWVEGYHHALVDKSHQRLTAFQWTHELGGDGHVWLFVVLHFGLRSAAGIFAMLVEPFVHEIKRRCGASLWLDAHVDDMIYIDASKEATQMAQTTAQALAALANIRLSEKKRQTPSQNAKILGIELDSVRGVMTMPLAKREKHAARAAALASHARGGKSGKPLAAPRAAIEKVAGGIQHLASLRGELAAIAPILLRGLHAAPEIGANFGPRPGWQPARTIVTIHEYGVQLLRTAAVHITEWSGACNIVDMRDLRRPEVRLPGASSPALSAAALRELPADGGAMRALAKEFEAARSAHGRDERTHFTAFGRVVSVVATDASDSGVGGTFISHDGRTSNFAAALERADDPSAARELQGLARFLTLIAEESGWTHAFLEEAQWQHAQNRTIGGRSRDGRENAMQILWICDADAAVQALIRSYSNASVAMQRALRAVIRARRTLERALTERQRAAAGIAAPGLVGKIEANEVSVTVTIVPWWRPREWMDQEDQMSRWCAAHGAAMSLSTLTFGCNAPASELFAPGVDVFSNIEGKWRVASRAAQRALLDDADPTGALDESGDAQGRAAAVRWAAEGAISDLRQDMREPSGAAASAEAGVEGAHSEEGRNAQ
jgi:hypothetical protein